MTGGRGYLGRRILPALERAGHAAETLEGGRARLDLADRAAVDDAVALSRPEVVVHLAGRTGAARPFAELAAAHVVGTATLIEAVAARLDATVAQVSLAWLLAKDVVPIPGTRHIRHLEANWAANDIVLDAATVAELDAAFPLGTTVGDRSPVPVPTLQPS